MRLLSRMNDGQAYRFVRTLAHPWDTRRPALCRVRARWKSVLLDQQPSLLTLRQRCSVFVRMIHRCRASNDADVSIASPKIPYGGFSPIRLQGRTVRRGLPNDISLPSPFVLFCYHRDSLLCVRGNGLMSTSVQADPPALPQGPSLRSGLCCPGPSSLNRPHVPHWPTRRNFPALRVMCPAFAVRA